MMLDLLIKNASLPDGRTDMDLAAQDGRFVAIEHGITAEAQMVIEAGGRLGCRVSTSPAPCSKALRFGAN
jgi:cytosine/creatinine deaminase